MCFHSNSAWANHPMSVFSFIIKLLFLLSFTDLAQLLCPLLFLYSLNFLYWNWPYSNNYKWHFELVTRRLYLVGLMSLWEMCALRKGWFKGWHEQAPISFAPPLHHYLKMKGMAIVSRVHSLTLTGLACLTSQENWRYQIWLLARWRLEGFFVLFCSFICVLLWFVFLYLSTYLLNAKYLVALALKTVSSCFVGCFPPFPCLCSVGTSQCNIYLLLMCDISQT